MKIEKYQKYFVAENLMGPNSVRLLGELLEKYPLKLSEEHRILDLGCGTGLTSLVISNETGAKVYANDLWISEDKNRARFEKWGKSENIIPVCQDANEFKFEKNFFDAVISMDAYHYLGGKPGFFKEKIFPFVKNGGIVMIAVPGIKEEFESNGEALLKDWAGDESYMFHSPTWWKNIIGEHQDIAEVETWEMKCFEIAWKEWFDTACEYAVADKSVYEGIIKPYTNFVGIMVRKK